MLTPQEYAAQTAKCAHRLLIITNNLHVCVESDYKFAGWLPCDKGLRQSLGPKLEENVTASVCDE